MVGIQLEVKNKCIMVLQACNVKADISILLKNLEENPVVSLCSLSWRERKVHSLVLPCLGFARVWRTWRVQTMSMSTLKKWRASLGSTNHHFSSCTCVSQVLAANSISEVLIDCPVRWLGNPIQAQSECDLMEPKLSLTDLSTWMPLERQMVHSGSAEMATLLQPPSSQNPQCMPFIQGF